MVKSAEELNIPDSGLPKSCSQCFFFSRGLAIKKIKNMALEHLDLWNEDAWRERSKRHQQGKDPTGMGGGRPLPPSPVLQRHLVREAFLSPSSTQGGQSSDLDLEEEHQGWQA